MIGLRQELPGQSSPAPLAQRAPAQLPAEGALGLLPPPGAAGRRFAEGEAGGSLQHGPSCSPEPAAGFLGQPRAGGTGLLPGSCSHELSDGPAPWRVVCCASRPLLCLRALWFPIPHSPLFRHISATVFVSIKKAHFCTWGLLVGRAGDPKGTRCFV